MLGACCCAKGGSQDGAYNDTAMVQDLPKTDELCMLQGVPKALDAPTDAASSLQPAKKDSGMEGLASPGQGSTFITTISRSEDEPIGLDIDLIDSVSAVVVDIKEGAVKKWNEKNPTTAIQVNDRIIMVNGARSEANALVMKLKSETTWELEVQRPSLYNVVISRENAPSLGMDLRYAPNGTTLMITQVGEGPMQDWNRDNPSKAVCKYDRIVQLNGIRGTPTDLLHSSEDCDTLDMCIVHYPEMGN